MRRLATLMTLALALAACAAPEFRLLSRFSPGEVREYRLVADVDVTIAAAGLSSTERTRLEATTTLAVEGTSTSGTTLMLTIAPTKFARDGKPVDLPTEQRVRIQVGSDGEIDEVSPVEGTGELDAAQIEDLVPLIGPPLPAGRVHLADGWTRPVPSPSSTSAGVQEARLAALRVVDGYHCGIVALSTRRPIVREREIAGNVLRLEGVEFAAGEIAFAFREGLPVTVRSNGEARLAISGSTAEGGGVVIRSNSVLTLVRRTGAS